MEQAQELEQVSTEMQGLVEATTEFVDLLSEICSKYGIEQDDIEAMNSGLENVWNSVTMSEELEEVEELPDESEEVEEVVDEEA